ISDAAFQAGQSTISMMCKIINHESTRQRAAQYTRRTLGTFRAKIALMMADDVGQSVTPRLSRRQAERSSPTRARRSESRTPISGAGSFASPGLRLRPNPNSFSDDWPQLLMRTLAYE